MPSCHNHAAAALGGPHRPSHISKMVLPTVHSGPAGSRGPHDGRGPLLGLGFRMALGFGRLALSLAPCLDATARAAVDRFGPRPPQLLAHRASKQPVPARPHPHIHAEPILAGVSRRTEPPRAGIAMLPHGVPALVPSVTLPALDHLQAAARPSPRPPPDLGPPLKLSTAHCCPSERQLLRQLYSLLPI